MVGTPSVPLTRDVGTTGSLRTSLVVSEAGSLGVEVALLWEAGGLSGRRQVGVARRHGVAGHLEQVRPDRMQPTVPGDPLIGLELPEQVEPCAGASDHGHRDGVVQRHQGLSTIRSDSSNSLR